MTKGFTLIELLVYIGVLTVTLVLVIVSMAGFARVYARIESQQALARSGSYVVERVVREARNAQAVDGTLSTFGAHPGRVGFVTPVTTGVTRSSEFFVDQGTLMVAEDGVTIGALTQPDIVVESFVVDHITTTQSEAVRVRLVLSTGPASSTVSASFYGTAVVRGSYAL